MDEPTHHHHCHHYHHFSETKRNQAPEFSGFQSKSSSQAVSHTTLAGPVPALAQFDYLGTHTDRHTTQHSTCVAYPFRPIRAVSETPSNVIPLLTDKDTGVVWSHQACPLFSPGHAVANSQLTTHTNSRFGLTTQIGNFPPLHVRQKASQPIGADHGGQAGSAFTQGARPPSPGHVWVVLFSSEPFAPLIPSF
ncbi:hypothetical protein MAPG_07196 [Magnaporthiopsis poae ATCC 64411]|uniref:Uncharacterized protein n=1 Tax=Magnaporthiopsis poae (strain ATCC 64411 / 73-15) TaxID=644358 RepID=A0A0C4E409_MAGP6|nr:hypothetical protein MAPG_07196 [Magnaporthiopsis poae ATCC 64411]